MAIYHYHADIIKRSAGHSSVAAAAYRAGEKMTDERTGVIEDYTRKQNCEANGILLPENAPAEFYDRGILWNAVEEKERRGDAQLCRSFDMAFPNKMPRDIQIEMLKDFAQEQFADKGMIADWACHRSDKEIRNDHAHILVTMREVGPDGFGNKNREWNDKALLKEWRKAWADKVNEYIDKYNIPENHISEKSLKDQGIDRTPQKHMGKAATALENKGIATEIGDYNREIKAFEKDIEKMRDILEDGINQTQRQIDFIDQNGGRLSAAQLRNHQEVLIVNMRGIDQFAESGLINEAEGADLRGRMAPLADELSMRLQMSAEHLGMSLEASESVKRVDNQKRYAIDDLIQDAEGIQTKQRETIAAMEDFQKARIAEEEERLERILAGNMDAREQQRMADYYEWAAQNMGFDFFNDDGTRKNTLQIAFECIVMMTTGDQILTERQRTQAKWLRDQEQNLITQSAEKRKETSKDLMQYIKAQNRTGWKEETTKSGSLRTAMDIAARYKLTTMEDIEEFLKRPDITPAQRRQIKYLMEQLIQSVEKGSKNKSGKVRTSPESFVPDRKNGTAGIPNLKLPAGGIIGALAKDIAKEGKNLIKQATKEATEDDISRER